MSMWFRRTVGSAGVAAAFLLLGASAAPAPAPAPGDSGIAQDLQLRVPESVRASIDGPNMIGDDFVDQSPYAGLAPVAADLPVGVDTLGR